MTTCPRCAGSGRVPWLAPPGTTAGSARTQPCPRCAGEGEVASLDPGEVAVADDQSLRRRRGGPLDPDGFASGASIIVPDPDNEGRQLAATFLEVAVGEPIDGRDSAWVRYEEGERSGTTGRVPYFRIRRA